MNYLNHFISLGSCNLAAATTAICCHYIVNDKVSGGGRRGGGVRGGAFLFCTNIPKMHLQEKDTQFIEILTNSIFVYCT